MKIQNLGAKTKKILLVDDDIIPLTVHKKILGELGYQTEFVTSGYEALDLIATKTEDYCAIIMDLNLPGLNGLEVIKFIRKGESKIKSIPIIVLTSYAEELKKECLLFGANEFMTKPINKTEIQKLLSKYVLENK